MSGYGVIVKEKSKGKYRKNDGSTLITVLVGVSFMVVLASIILSVSFSNLKMKQLEYRNKRNFFILIFSGLEETIIFSCYACTSVIFPLQCIFRMPSGIVSLSPVSTQMLPIKPLPDAT